ncbi:transcriptional regulator, partial [Lactobacillus crispatus]
CLVEQAVNAALGDAFRDAEALLIERLGNVSLADLADDFRTRYAAHRRGRKRT